MTGGWQELSPWNLKKSDQPRATIRAAIAGKHRAPVVYIGINSLLCKELEWDVGGEKLARVDLGTGDNAGKMRIEQSEKGRFRLAVSGKRGPNNGVRLVMRLPSQPAATSRPQIIDHEVVGQAVILSIPKEWADVVSVQPYSKVSAPVTGKPIGELHSARRLPEAVAVVEVKPDVLEMLKGAESMRQVVCTGKTYELRGDDEPIPVPLLGDIPAEPQKVRLIKREHLSIVRPIKSGGNGYKPGKLLDLGHDQCRFTVEGTTMCGAETIRDKSWCAHHFPIVYPTAQRQHGRIVRAG